MIKGAAALGHVDAITLLHRHIKKLPTSFEHDAFSSGRRSHVSNATTDIFGSRNLSRKITHHVHWNSLNLHIVDIYLEELASGLEYEVVATRTKIRDVEVFKFRYLSSGSFSDIIGINIKAHVGALVGDKEDLIPYPGRLSIDGVTVRDINCRIIFQIIQINIRGVATAIAFKRTIFCEPCHIGQLRSIG